MLIAANFFGISRIGNDAIRIFLFSLSSTIATVILASVLWEVIAKENSAKSLHNQVKISENNTKSEIDVNGKTKYTRVLYFTIHICQRKPEFVKLFSCDNRSFSSCSAFIILHAPVTVIGGNKYLSNR